LISSSRGTIGLRCACECASFGAKDGVMIVATRANLAAQFRTNMQIFFRVFPFRRDQNVGDLKLFSQSNLNENWTR